MMQVVIVTGAAGGIGCATARRFGAEGFAVLAGDVDLPGAERVAADIRAAGGEARGVSLDVTSRDEWELAAESARDFGRLSAVVNNAGIVRDSSLRKMTDQQWKEVIDVNLRGAFLGSQIGAREMEEHGGAIVTLSSVAAFGSFGQANYAAAKGGVVSLTRTVALEGAKRGVRANAVAPGTVSTAMIESVPSDVRQRWLEETPLRRFAEPSEIASVIWFLCSPDASYITGQVIVVDGGVTLGA